MIRFLLRSAGFLLLAAAFVGLVLDGARSIANDGLGFTTVSDIALGIARDRWLAFQPAVERSLGPATWTYAFGPLSRAPASVVSLLLGALFLRLGQPPREPIGFLARR